MKASKKALWSIAIILFILIADQVIKIWVKTQMQLGEDIQITPWFHIRFIENNGMAMGIQVFGKLFLTFFRIAASVAIAYYIYLLIRNKFKFSYIFFISMIFAGAVGNIIDSIFYGVIFNNGSWFRGEVVDMFYFPLFSFKWASWVPLIGGTTFEFFRYIFNLADASISVGIIVLLLFFRKTLSLSFEKQKVES